MLPKGLVIDSYTISFPIKEGHYAETYRVKDDSNMNFFLKLIDCTKLHKSQYHNGNILEIEISKHLSHPNITTYHDSGEIVISGQHKAFLVYEFISGETLAQKITRVQRCSAYEAKQIASGVLNGLKFLHNLPSPVIHNELTIQNVMLDMTKSCVHPKIIDFEYARFLNQGRRSFHKTGLNPFYLAPEAFNGVFSSQTDLYSVGAMLYHLLFGLPPFFFDLSKYKDDADAAEEAIIAEKNRALRIPNSGKKESFSNLIPIILKALAPNAEDRFQSVEEFIKTLNGEIKLQVSSMSFGTGKLSTKWQTKKMGNGFADVAGMHSLKDQLQNDVINLLKNPEKAESLGLHVPNGLLFYGPPGCGKTFFAEKFAEELGCYYQYVKCSDVASPYIHGGQEKIASIFNEARKNAPAVLFFDEIEAMIKDRSKHTNVSEAGEVNEFLAQLNNCGQDGVIVIGATNKLTEIDEAALRAGRLEYKYYIPQPDFETRTELLRINLMNRKTDFGIDYDKLAHMTENYVSADIRLIVDTAARFVFRRHLDCITMDILEEAINKTKPSVTMEIIKKHEAIRDEFEGVKPVKPERRKIGF